MLIYVQLTFPTANRSLAIPSWETVSLVQNANISQADREMSSALRFKLWVLVSPPARALGTLRAVSGIRASRSFAAIQIQDHRKLASSESYRQVEEIEVAEPVQEVVVPALGLQALLSPHPGLLSHSTEALANLGLERVHFLDRNRRSPTSLMI